ERTPRRAAGDHADEVGVVDGGDDDGGISGVGEVVHRPCPHFARPYAIGERGAVAAGRTCIAVAFFVTHGLGMIQAVATLAPPNRAAFPHRCPDRFLMRRASAELPPSCGTDLRIADQAQRMTRS